MSMTPREYQTEAIKTEHTPCFIRSGHGDAHDVFLSRVLHALLGLCDELGELAKAVKAHLIYGKPLDEINLVEECGDHDWYRVLLADALRVGLEESWTRNIAKLRKRYGDKFSADRALNRNLAGERAALETPTQPRTRSKRTSELPIRAFTVQISRMHGATPIKQTVAPSPTQTLRGVIVEALANAGFAADSTLSGWDVVVTTTQASLMTVLDLPALDTQLTSIWVRPSAGWL